MPDIIEVLSRHRNKIFLLTLAATVIALTVSLLRSKKFLATTTAVPTNTALNDKGRLFNNNVEALYPQLGSPDELDKIEGTAKLDTVFISLATEFNLAAHYEMDKETEPAYKAALTLKKASTVSRTAYGELQIKVWDGDATLAANLANAFLQKLNSLYRHAQAANIEATLRTLKDDVMEKQRVIDSIDQGVVNYKRDTGLTTVQIMQDYVSGVSPRGLTNISARVTALSEFIKEEQKLITQYELALKAAPDALVVIEKARPSLYPDKPRLAQTTVFAFFASLLFSVLLSFLLERRKQAV